jgi:thiol-disulfide isomerase/thioredoxin
VAAVLVLASMGALALRRRDGRLAGPARTGSRQPTLTGDELGQPLGSNATLLQFSSSFCAPCRAARQLLADVAARNAGVTHVEINVADRLDLVRRLDVRRTPTAASYRLRPSHVPWRASRPGRCSDRNGPAGRGKR